MPKPKAIKFKAGDRVALDVLKWGAVEEGDEGTVLGVDPHGHYLYQIEFDRCPRNRHYCDNEHIRKLKPGSTG